MSPDERMLITQLFERLRGAATAQRDPEAESFIRQQIAQQPYAPYAMAQTIVAQSKALEATQARIKELEANVPESPYYGRESEAGFAGPTYAGQRPMGAPGYGAAQPSQSPWHTDRAPVGAPASAPVGGPSPWGGQPQQPQPWQQQPQPQQGGGFLAGAMQTALGVAGGAMLFEGMRDLFGGGRESSSAADANSLADPNAVDRFAASDDSGDNGGGDNGGGGWFSNIFGGGDGDADSNEDDLGGDDGDNGDDWA